MKIIKKFKELSREQGKLRAAKTILLLGAKRGPRYARELNDYLRHKLKLPYKFNLNQIELDLISVCNLQCLNCDHSCRQAPSQEQINVEQIKKFIKESVDLGKKWKQIRILGGEPTLHKDLIEICNLFLNYKKDFSRKSEIMLFTNGHGPAVQNILKTIPEGIYIRNSAKQTPVHLFSTYNVAPIDLKDFHKKNEKNYCKGCQVTQMCGIGLTRYGYYACGAGASADRIFGWDIGIKKLSLVNEESLRKQLTLMCQYCGHFKNWGRHFLSSGPQLSEKEEISESWQNAYNVYKNKKPNNSLY